MKRWMIKKAGTVVLAAATGLGTLAPAPLWSQNPDPAGAEIQRRLAELYAREGKTMPDATPQQRPQPVSAAPQSLPRIGSGTTSVPQIPPRISPPAQPERTKPFPVEMTPRQTVNGTRWPEGIQAPVSGQTPPITNTPVTRPQPLITPSQPVVNTVEKDPASPIPAIRPIPVPQTKTAAKPSTPSPETAFPASTPWSQPAAVTTTEPRPEPQSAKNNPFEMPTVKKPGEQPGDHPLAGVPPKNEQDVPVIHPLQEPKIAAPKVSPTPVAKTAPKATPNRAIVPLSPFAKPREDVRITPHPLSSHPVDEKRMNAKLTTPKTPSIVKSPNHSVGNPFEMPTVKEQALAPPRPAIIKTRTKRVPKPPSGNPFEMPVAKKEAPVRKTRPVAKTDAKETPKETQENLFEMPLVKEDVQRPPSAPVVKMPLVPSTEFEMPRVAKTPSKNVDGKKEAAPTLVGNPFAVLQPAAPQSKSKVKANPKPVTKPEVKLTKKTEPKPVTKPEVKTVSKTTPKLVEKPIAQTTPKASSLPVPKPEPIKVATIENKPAAPKQTISAKQDRPISKPQPTLTQGNAFLEKSVSSPSTHRLPPVALEGCCPVTLREQHKRVKGRPELIGIWKRASYHFASPEAQRKFEQNPNNYLAFSVDGDSSHSAAQQTAVVAMDGCCPVTLREERKLVKGRSDLVCLWERTSYRFTSTEAQQKFEQNPSQYAPAESGFDITLRTDTNQEVPGSLKHAVWYQKELYLFQSEATQNRFTSNPEKYINKK